MPYLVRCLESVASQTLDADRMEIIAIDDGSTDGTGEHLERFAASTPIPMTVLRQANSGGPSGPRNVGLRRARGRYVFFLDADDFLGYEALERMVAMADRAGTDVVLGKLVGVNRGAPGSMWQGTHERVDIYSSRVIYTLSAQKLFRRELLTRLGLEFDEKLKTGEDALFTMEAYIRGAGVSVISDYVCYYLVGRDDGKHVTRSGSYEPRFAALRALMELIARLVPEGPQRDFMMVRPFTVGLLQQFGPCVLKESEEVRRHKLELVAPLMDAYWHPGVAQRIKVGERIRLEYVARGRLDWLDEVLRFLAAKREPEVVPADRGSAAYLAYPHFRDAQAQIPDSVFELTVPEYAPGRRLQAPPRQESGRAVPARPQASFARRAVRRLRRDVRRWRAEV